MEKTTQSLSLFNINIMHGRNSKSAVFPPYKHRSTIKSNLQKIALTIQKYSPDIVAIQEIDSFSVLSGCFNQVEYLNEKLDYPYVYFGPSCSIKILDKDIFVSGNAIFSKFPIIKQDNILFDITFPTDRMGFVTVDVELPTKETFSVYSVHLVYLDWLHSDSRKRELNNLERHVGSPNNNIVIAGDFNCEYLGKEDSLRYFIGKNNLSVFNSENKDGLTHPSWGPEKRIDWIVLSNNLTFISHETVPDVISDHLAVFAKVSL